MEKIEWEADEYTSSKRGPVFYIAFALAVLSLCALAIMIRSWTFLAVIIVAAVALIVQTHGKPPKARYAISPDEIKINARSYPLADFKSYSIALNTAAEPISISFVPRKRFKGQVTLQFGPKFELKKLQKLLEKRLPEVTDQAGLLDIISQKIRG